MNRSQVRNETGSGTRSRSRGALVGVVIAAIALLVGVWWWLARDASGPTRDVDPAQNDEVAARAAFELAASSLPSAARAEPIAEALPSIAAPQPASPTGAEAPHLLVTRADAPLVGARVELWNEPEVGEGESFVFTSDTDGRVVLPADLETRGPWFALAAGDGACSEQLLPWPVDTLAASTEMRCVDMHHVAIVFERSDGAPIGGWDGVYMHEMNELTDKRRDFGEHGPDERIRRALLAAGLAPSIDLHTAARVVVAWHTKYTVDDHVATGQFAEPDTDEVEWTVHMRPLARGGALERVAIPVRDDVASGWVEIRIHGESVVGALDSFAGITLSLLVSLESDPRILTLVVRDQETPMASARTLFRVPAGHGLAHLHLGRQLANEEPLQFVVLPEQTVAVDFDLPVSGAIVLDAKAHALLSAGGPWLVLRAFDVATGGELTHEFPQKDATAAVLDPGRLIVRVLAPLHGFLVPIGAGERLAADAAVHAELLGHPSRHKNRSVPPQLSAAAEPFLVDVRAGGETQVEFVPDPPREEKR